MYQVCITHESDCGEFSRQVQGAWRYQGKAYCLSLGIVPTPSHRAYAKQIADKVLGDILLNQFDETLVRYKPWAIGSDPAGGNCPELFEAYTEAIAQDKGLVAGSLAKYRGCLSHLSLHVSIMLVRQR